MRTAWAVWVSLCGLAAGAPAQVGEIVARRGAVLQGEVEATVQLLDGSAVEIGPGARLGGDLLVAPSKAAGEGAQANRDRLQARIDAANTAAGRKTLQGAVRTTAAFALPPVAAPKTPAGSQSRVVRGSDAVEPDFSDVRDLTVSYAFESVALPPGVYGDLLVESSRLVLGVAGSPKPVRYDFQSLSLLKNARIDLVGPVIVTVGRIGAWEGLAGQRDLPGWLDLRVKSGDVALAAESALHGFLSAPESKLVLGERARLEGGANLDEIAVATNAHVRGVPADWQRVDSRELAPTFPQKANRAQLRVAALREVLAEHYETTVGYPDDVPTAELTAKARSTTDPKWEAEERKAVFETLRMLLNQTGFEQARVTVHRATESRSRAEGGLTIAMERYEFEEHVWALTRRPVVEDGIREIQGSTLLQNLFMTRVAARSVAAVELKK